MAGRIPRAESWDGFPVLDGTGSNESTDLRIPMVFDRILRRNDTRAPGSYRRPRDQLDTHAASVALVNIGLT